MVIKTGSPMYEVLNVYYNDIEQSDILKRLNLTERQYFVVSAHREENVDSDKNFLNLVETLNTIAETYQLPIIFSAHPRTQKRIDDLAVSFDSRIRLLKPLGFIDYNRLQLSAKTVLSDSGTISEESSILDFPALNIRQAHERPEGMEEASVMMVGLEVNRVMQALNVIDSEKQSLGQNRKFRLVADYSMSNVSDKIVRIIHSYTDYVNRVVWKKY